MAKQKAKNGFRLSILIKILFLLIILLVSAIWLCVDIVNQDGLFHRAKSITNNAHIGEKYITATTSDNFPLAIVKSNIPLYDVSASKNFVINDDPNASPNLKAQYIHTAAVANYEGEGVFKVCIDEYEMNQGSSYLVYAIEDNEFVAYPNKHFTNEYTIFDNKFYVDFEYSICNGKLVLTHVSAERDEEKWRIENVAMGANEVLITFYCSLPDGGNLSYPMVLNVETHELTDFLQNMDAKTLFSSLSQRIKHIRFVNPDTVIVERSDGEYFYFNIVTGEVFDLKRISGLEIEDCALVQNQIVCWDLNGNYGWIDVDSLVFHPLISVGQTEFSSGIWCENGCSFVLYRANDNTIHLYDFMDCEDVILKPPNGWQLIGDRIHPSPDGRKFLLQTTDDKGIIQILVFNCDTQSWVVIERDNPNNSDESLIEWSAANEIVVTSKSRQDFYIYQFVKLQD